MKIGIFVNKKHKNYIPYIAFLTSQISKYSNIHIHYYDNLSIFSEYSYYDLNIFLNRYCLLDFDFIINKLSTTKSYILNIDHNLFIPIAILSKATIKTIDKKHRIVNFLCKPYRFKFDLIDQYMFSCYDDMNDFYIDSLKEYYYKKKAIFYNKKMYYIDPKTQFKRLKNTDIARLNKNLTVTWDNKKQKWIKFTSKEKV